MRADKGMARLPYLEKSDLAPEHPDLLARNINLFRAMAHSPSGARAFSGLGQYFRFQENDLASRTRVSA